MEADPQQRRLIGDLRHGETQEVMLGGHRIILCADDQIPEGYICFLSSAVLRKLQQHYPEGLASLVLPLSALPSPQQEHE